MHIALHCIPYKSIFLPSPGWCKPSCTPSTPSQDMRPITMSFSVTCCGLLSGRPGSIPGLGRSPGEGKGCALQYSGLENSVDCTVHGVTKSQTRLRDFHFPSLHPAHKAQNICGSCPFTSSFLFLVQVLGYVWWGRGAQVMGALLCMSQKTEIISRCVWKIKFCNRTGVTLYSHLLTLSNTEQHPVTEIVH